MKIGYIVHNLNDAAVERRITMLEYGGADVLLAGFCRDKALKPNIAARAPFVLGTSADAAFVTRTVGALKNAVLSGPLKRFFGGADVIMARNLEQLVIARQIKKARPLIYECLDIHRLLVGSSAAAKIVQAAESRLLPHCDVLMTSSPAFVSNHFLRRPFKGATMLVENKLLVEDGMPQPHCAPAPADVQPITIGWFGMLRCAQSLRFLADLVTKADGALNILIAGKPSPAEVPDLEEVVAATPGMRFLGPYRYADLQALYGQCHFAWTIDWFEEGLNSSWLLPNRLYESLAFGVVPIALEDIELGRWLDRHNVGLTVTTPEDVPGVLVDMDPKTLQNYQNAVKQLPRGAVLCTRQEAELFVNDIRAAIAP